MAAEFSIIIDTREQLPFSFEQFGAEVVRQVLPSGDYAVSGLEDRCVIERKSPSDLLGCMATGRDRFTAELERLDEYEYAAVVVEGLESDLFSTGSRMNPKSIKATLVAWDQRYRAKWHFCPGRAWAERTTFLLLQRFWRDVRDGKRPAATELEALTV